MRGTEVNDADAAHATRDWYEMAPAVKWRRALCR